ncbi:hypothetical protein B0O80DRAFT_194625 [Mortierella sp. GBAus27b]|nr:rab guanine nucleotide exchange factor S2 [Mortierella sp. GBA43]KAI8360100.1 hypothetical protein B0O80DRAFT_194625 [Mortierella sp. GBAus27b]
MSIICDNCGAAVQLTTSLNHQQLHLPNDPLIPFVKAQIEELTAQNSSLVAENDTLSNKLVESTEGRMDLDQQLNVAQMELQAVQSELQTLRENQKHYEQLLTMMSSGQLIERKDIEPMIENLVYESQRRSQIESSKLKLESELEDLSRSLFEEANRMVNEERQANFQARQKIEGLERQLDEVLDLCKSERDQLMELKSRMAKVSEEKDTIQQERDALEFALVQQQQQLYHHAQLLSSSPTSAMHHHVSTTSASRRGMGTTSTSSSVTGSTLGPNMDAMSLSRKHAPFVPYESRQQRSSASSIKSKTDSCFFSDEDHPESHLPNDPNEDRVPTLGFHLWDPSFIEFKTYIESIFGTPSKASGELDSARLTPATSSVYSFGIMNKPASPAASNNAVIPISSLLSNCRLLKKMLAEDVEATLKFEPGNLLSWSQRKRLMTAVSENTLVIEVVPMNLRDQNPSPVASAHPLSLSTSPVATNANTKPNCALCGHSISTPLYYQYRLMDTSNESRTICPYCRTRLTSVCTFYSVLRMISKRIISSTTTPEKLYLDFLRIRLGMFLARCGVGIVTGDEVKPKRESTRSQFTASTGVPSLPPPPRASERVAAKLAARSGSANVSPALSPIKSPTINRIPGDATLVKEIDLDILHARTVKLSAGSESF